MKYFFHLFVFILFFSSVNFGQIQDTMQTPTLSVISQVNQGTSYITFPTDIGNIEPLWFEADLIPNFYLREGEDSRLVGVLTPRIITRMYQAESNPVRTPSYMPQITLYYLFKKKINTKTITLYLRLAHHSNGQEGDFYLENGDYNLKDGSFSTNYFEPGLIATNLIKSLNAYQFFKTSFAIHPDRWTDKVLEKKYSQYRWHFAFSIFKLPAENMKNKKKRAAVSLKGEASWLFGNYNDLNIVSSERFNLCLSVYYHPKFLADIGFFLQYYHGSDYYNIYFNHRIDILRFGIMTEKLQF